MAQQSDKQIKGIKLRRLILRWLLIIFITLPIISLAWWYVVKDTKPLNLLILDKTVLNTEGNEHRSFNWILEHLKYAKPDGNFYEIESDYKGFFPLDSFKYYLNDLDQYSYDQLDSMTWDLDMVYYTDCYGIYTNEWHAHSESTEHSPLIYGGMSMKDFQVLKHMKDKDKLIISEFNLIATPTPYRVRRATENEFGMEWSGWTGRYFGSLDTLVNPEIPHWIVRLYTEQYGPWKFTKSGIVFVHVSERIVILENEEELDHEIPIINTPPHIAEKFGVVDYVRYPFWFDITYAKEDTAIMATYRIYPNEKGDSILALNRIPKEFPAIISRPDKHRFYYFAGDFADNPISYWAVRSSGIEYFDVFLYNNQEFTDRRKFFWRYYEPLMSTILNEYYEEMRSRDLLFADEVRSVD